MIQPITDKEALAQLCRITREIKTSENASFSAIITHTNLKGELGTYIIGNGTLLPTLVEALVKHLQEWDKLGENAPNN